MHNDATGKPLAIGDKVVYAGSYRANLRQGWVSDFTPKRVRIAYTENGQGGVIKDPLQIAKVE